MLMYDAMKDFTSNVRTPESSKHKLAVHSKRVDPKEADLWTDKIELDREERDRAEGTE
jgi:hypothetical protein